MQKQKEANSAAETESAAGQDWMCQTMCKNKKNYPNF